MVEFVEQPANGSGKISLRWSGARRIGRIREPPAVDPGQLPGPRDTAADEAAKITEGFGDTAGSVGRDDEADQLDVGNQPRCPLSGSGLRRPQPSQMRSGDQQHRCRRGPANQGPGVIRGSPTRRQGGQCRLTGAPVRTQNPELCHFRLGEGRELITSRRRRNATLRPTRPGELRRHGRRCRRPSRGRRTGHPRIGLLGHLVNLPMDRMSHRKAQHFRDHRWAGSGVGGADLWITPACG